MLNAYFYVNFTVSIPFVGIIVFLHGCIFPLQIYKS